jgi:hypothetical protein
MIHTLKQISIFVYDKFLKYKTINHRVKGVKNTKQHGVEMAKSHFCP